MTPMLAAIVGFALSLAAVGAAILVSRARAEAAREYDALAAWMRGESAAPPTTAHLPGGAALVRETSALDHELTSLLEEAARLERDVGEASALRSSLVAHLTHDLRSPLNAIVGFTEALLADPFAELGEEQRQSLVEIRSAAVELERLVVLLLDTARLEARKLPVTGAQVAVVELVTRTLEQLRDRDVLTLVDVALVPGLPTVWVDRPRLVRALAALVAHALDAGKGARFSARLEFEDGVPLVALALTLSTGIEPSRYARLSTGEASLGAATRPRLASAAVALSFARGLLALSGGRLSCEANDAGAPCFRFWLPVRPSREARASAQGRGGVH